MLFLYVFSVYVMPDLLTYSFCPHHSYFKHLKKYCRQPLELVQGILSTFLICKVTCCDVFLIKTKMKGEEHNSSWSHRPGKPGSCISDLFSDGYQTPGRPQPPSRRGDPATRCLLTLQRHKLPSSTWRSSTTETQSMTISPDTTRALEQTDHNFSSHPLLSLLHQETSETSTSSSDRHSISEFPKAKVFQPPTISSCRYPQQYLSPDSCLHAAEQPIIPQDLLQQLKPSSTAHAHLAGLYTGCRVELEGW